MVAKRGEHEVLPAIVCPVTAAAGSLLPDETGQNKHGDQTLHKAPLIVRRSGTFPRIVALSDRVGNPNATLGLSLLGAFVEI